MFVKQFILSARIQIDKIHNILSWHDALLQSLIKYFKKTFHSVYGNLLKDITMIMKTIKNYYNAMLYEIDYYKSK